MNLKGQLEDIVGPYGEQPISDKEAHLIYQDVIHNTDTLERLRNDATGAEDKIRMLHSISVIGQRNDYGEIIRGGNYRRSIVGFGTDFVAPKYEDIPILMSTFGEKLEALSMQVSNLEDINLLATWAHLSLIGIHPFEDGNGRTARALVEYIRYARCQELGISYEPLNLPGSSNFDDSTRFLVDSFFSLEFKPKGFRDLNVSGESDVANFYTKLKESGKSHEYYAELKDNILNHLTSINNFSDLRKIHEADVLAKNLKNVDSWLTGKETISLLGKEMVERAKLIYGTDE